MFPSRKKYKHFSLYILLFTILLQALKNLENKCKIKNITKNKKKKKQQKNKETYVQPTKPLKLFCTVKRPEHRLFIHIPVRLSHLNFMKTM